MMEEIVNETQFLTLKTTTNEICIQEQKNTKVSQEDWKKIFFFKYALFVKNHRQSQDTSRLNYWAEELKSAKKPIQNKLNPFMQGIKLETETKLKMAQGTNPGYQPMACPSWNLILPSSSPFSALRLMRRCLTMLCLSSLLRKDLPSSVAPSKYSRSS